MHLSCLNSKAVFEEGPADSVKKEIKTSLGPLYVYYPPNVTPYILAPYGTKKDLSLLKSNLQKAVRRKESDSAVLTALAMFSIKPIELLRRLPVIIIEDSLPHPESFVKLIWWMCAVSKGYKLSAEEVADLLGMVWMSCQTSHFIVFNSKCTGDGKFDYALNTPEGTFLQSLVIRREFRGMAVDQQMIDYHVTLWNRYFREKPEWYSYLQSQEVAAVDIAQLPPSLRNAF